MPSMALSWNITLQDMMNSGLQVIGNRIQTQPISEFCASLLHIKQKRNPSPEYNCGLHDRRCCHNYWRIDHELHLTIIMMKDIGNYMLWFCVIMRSFIYAF